MPTIVDTPSKGCAARFQGPSDSEQEFSAVDSREDAHARPAAVDGQGSHSVKRFDLVEDPSFWKDHNVQVIIRVRPLNSTEISLQGQKRCIRQDSCQSISWTGHPESRFTFDLVADEYISQEKLFKVAGVPMVDNCVSGYNSCMFAYGQTGSGKTHTMLGDIEGGTRRHSVNCGMTPRVFEYLFSKIQKEKEIRREENIQFVCKCSFLEIYNEHILDLLDPSSLNLQIREDLKKGVHVENLSEFEVSSARDVIQHLLQGAANRKVAATNMNRASSRSHSVFTCVIESKWESQGITHHRFSRLNLVDLAGSERQKSSGAEGERLKEATNINKSLSTLGLVIMNLVGISNKKSLHVPYRDSKLTFLLQESLGGNSKTTIIANISPSNCCALETLSTLKFAQRAKFIRNNAIVNEEASGDVYAMRLEIQELKKEISRLQSLAGHKKEDAANGDGSAHILGSPSYFNWEGIQGTFSPLAVDKRSSKRKDFEAALAAAFRREMEKEKALQAITAEKLAAEQLANQMNDEVNSLKMRIRFREEGIKRLQAVVAGKLSADSHLVQEKEELLKEIEILRAQVDCNPKITSFAMENLRLKEQVRRLESFVEAGEREMMNEQINDLQEKLLEALDWKLMHEKDSGVQDLSQSWDPTSLSEENEFLRLQAIQNEKEVETLRKNLSFCMEAREKLERRVDELTLQLEDATAAKERDSSRAPDELPHQQQQEELKAMVEAIAAASQREAEAHERTILLSRENEELRSKLALLIDDNNKLILFYEAAVSQKQVLEQEHRRLVEEAELEKKEAEDLRGHLHDLQEENEKLMGLYEAAMHERDNCKKTLLLLQQQQQQRQQQQRQIEAAPIDEEEGDFHEEKEAAGKFCEETVEMLCELWQEMRSAEEHLRRKQEEISSSSVAWREAESKKKEAEERLVHLLRVASSFQIPVSDVYDDLEKKEEDAQRELDCNVKVAAEKAEELRQLLSLQEEVSAGLLTAAKLESELRMELGSLKNAYRQAEEKRKETKKVLFSIENTTSGSGEGAAPPVRKAFELLQGEEELPKLALKMKSVKQRIAAAVASVNEASQATETLKERVKSAAADAATAAEGKVSAETALQEVRREKERAEKMLDEGRALEAKAWEAAMELQEMWLMAAAKEEELRACEVEDVTQRARRKGKFGADVEDVLQRARRWGISEPRWRMCCRE